MAKNTPDTTSSDYDAMLPYWDKVEAILGGRDAVIAGGETYLPRFPNETDADYQYRLDNAKFTNVYKDIVDNLASKPFAEEVGLGDGAPERFLQLAEDIDGRGNNLHVFAETTFSDGLNNAIDWIFVDYTKARPRADGQRLSIAEERKQGLRPYWVHVPAKKMLAAYSDKVGDKEVFTHARMLETVVRRDGFGEVCVERVRVLNREPIYEVIDGAATDRIIGYEPATYEVWEKKATGRRTGSQWTVVESGPVTIGVIAIVPFATGKRKGGSWRFIPPMQGVADLQVEHYQAETALKHIKELTAFPMLAGNGVQPAIVNGEPAPVPVGPQAVLYAPPIMGDTSATHGEWKFIEPTAESLKFLASEVEAIEKQMRELGRQPLTATAGITVVTAALASQKASSAVQAWAYRLKDALEQAFVYTAMWLNLGADAAPEVTVYTDFALDASDDKGLDALTKARENKDLSRRTYWAELRRRGQLSGDFDPEEEERALEEELPDEDTEDEIAGATTPPQRVAT